MNRCEIIGNLGGDPEMRYLEDGTPVTTFSVAVNRRWTDRTTGEEREKTWWFRVTTWRKLAETCNQYLTKGKQVFVAGEIGVSAWVPDGEDEARGSLELTAREVKFLGGNGNGNKPPIKSDEELEDEAESIPF